MKNISESFLQLITNISQIKERGKAIQLFIDGINSILPDIKADWLDIGTFESGESIMISTENSNYGYLKFEKHNLPNNKLNALQNAARMFAFILENNEILNKTNDTFIKNKEWYKIFFETSPSCIIVIHKGKYIFANNSAANLFGFESAEELIGLGLSETIHPDYLEVVKTRLKKIDDNKKNKTITIKVIRKDKKERFFEAFSRSIRFNNLECSLVHGNDVTDKTLAEEELIAHMEELKATTEALEQSEGKFKILIENQGEGVGITNRDNIFTYANKAAHDIFGVEEGTLEGASLKDFTSEDEFNIVLAESKEREKGIKSTYELEIKTPDGKKKWILITATPFFDNRGSFTNSFGIFRDITKRKQAEKELARSELIMHSFIKQSYEGIIMIDQEGKIFEWNKAMEDISGYAAKEFKGQYIWDVNYTLSCINEKDTEYYTNIKKRSIEILRTKTYSEFNRIVERRIKKKDGQNISIQQITFPIEMPEGNIIGSIILDISERKKNIARLNAEKEKAEMYFKVAGSILIVISKDQIITDINKRGCELLGDEYDNIVGKNWFSNYIPDEIRTNMREGFLIFANESPSKLEELFADGFENDIINKKGERRTIRWYNTALFDERNNLLGVLSSGIDVTETQKANQELKETSLILESTLNAIPDIIGIQGKNHDVIKYNKAGHELLSLKDVELQGKKCYELIGRFEPCNECATDLSHISKKPEKVIRFEKGLNLWLDIRAYPIQDENGEIKMVIEHIRDITKNVESEQELKKIRIAVDQSPASIVITSSKGVIEYVNPKFTDTTGFTYEEAIGKNPNIQKSGKHDIKFYKDLWGTITSGNVWKGELINKNKNGEIFWESALISPIIDKNNKITHFIAIKENIGDKKNLEQMRNSKEVAERSAKLKQQFLANMSHEMRTPMNGIIGMADILMNTRLSEKQKQHLQVIKDSSQSLLYLINDVLDISRIDQGKMKLFPEVFSLTDVTRQLKELFYPAITKKKLSLHIHIDPAFPNLIFADENRLKQILSNLLSNAVKYTNEGEIIIKVNLINKTADFFKSKIEIIDTGIGIKEEDQNNLFFIFSRIDDSLTRKTEGSGLGLAIAKKLAEMMNGEIGVISEFGQGSNFWFTFEAKISKETNLIKKKINPQALSSKKYNLKVLYAEDKIVNQKVVSLMLQNAGCQVTIANNGLEVITKFKEQSFDIIFMDIMMPEMDGITAMLELQKNYTKIPPIIGLSANAMEGDAEKYIKMGMNDYLTKPVNRNELLSILSKWGSK